MDLLFVPIREVSPHCAKQIYSMSSQHEELIHIYTLISGEIKHDNMIDFNKLIWGF